MFFFGSSSKNKIKYDMTHQELADNIQTLAIMKGKKYTCTAMWHLTHETIYKVALETIKKAIKKLKKVIKHGARRFSDGGNLHRAILSYEDFRRTYEMTVLQVEVKMHPCRAENVLMEMLDRTVAEEPIDTKWITFRQRP